MRIHTNLHRDMILTARRPAGVQFARLDQAGSRTRRNRFDVILTGTVSGRLLNSGRYGALDIGEGNAATWDEWGIFLAQIFEADPIAHCWAYMGADDFHWKTGDRFKTLTHDGQHANHQFRNYRDYGTYVERDCVKVWHHPDGDVECGAMQRYHKHYGPNAVPMMRATGQGFAPKGTTYPPTTVTAAEAFLAS